MDHNSVISGQMQKAFMNLPIDVTKVAMSFCNKNQALAFQYHGVANKVSDSLAKECLISSIRYLEYTQADVVVFEDGEDIPKECKDMVAKLIDRKDVIEKKIVSQQNLGPNFNIIFSSRIGNKGEMATSSVRLDPKPR